MDQWDPRDFHLANRDLNGDAKTTTVELGRITFSSSEVWNGLIYEISETIDDDCLEELTIENIVDVNGTIESWPLSIIETKSSNLKILTLDYLPESLGRENLECLVETASHICAISTCLSQLTVREIFTEKEVGDMLLQSMCDAENLVSLQKVDFSLNEKWFAGRQEPIEMLVRILSRQPALSEVNLGRCGLDAGQKDQITSALAGREVAFEF